MGAEGKAVRRSGGGGLNKAGAEGKTERRSGGGVWGSDSGHEWPSKLGSMRGVHTWSVATVVAEIVVCAGERGMGSEQLKVGGTSPSKPMPGVNVSIAVKPQAWMRWMLTVSGLVRRLGPVRSRCGRGAVEVR